MENQEKNGLRYLRTGVFFLCVLLCLGGAVNSGFSAFSMATPAAIYILVRICRTKLLHSRLYRSYAVAGSLVFFGLCVLISITQDSNRYIYPILDGGVITFTRSVTAIQYQGSKEIYVHTPDFTERALSDGHAKAIKPYTSGMVLPVVGIAHTYADFADQIDLLAKDGDLLIRIRAGNYSSSASDQRIATPSVVHVQAPLAKYFGLLMYWPVFPVAIIALVNSFSTSS